MQHLTRVSWIVDRGSTGAPRPAASGHAYHAVIIGPGLGTVHHLRIYAQPPYSFLTTTAICTELAGPSRAVNLIFVDMTCSSVGHVTPHDRCGRSLALSEISVLFNSPAAFRTRTTFQWALATDDF